jgi:squalene-hopene/tetraprenyl-beta-curcumene cyclase
MIAAVLAADDAANSGKLRVQTRKALERMWELQRPDGCWNWLKAKEPPSAVDDHFGVTMAVCAAGEAPEGYAAASLAQAGLKKAVAYLRSHPPTNMHQRLMLLQASRFAPDLVTPLERRQTLADLFAAQRPDGGWTMASLVDWKRLDGTPQEFDHSDGYGTGIAVYTLRIAGGAPLSDARVQKGLAWLRTQQRESGAWFTRSPRKADELTTFAGTAYAIRALSAWGALGE